MKATKRLISALLAALLTLSLAACDKDSGNSDGKVDIPTTQTGTDDFPLLFSSPSLSRKICTRM